MRTRQYLLQAILSCLLAGTILTIYWPVSRHSFLVYDDDLYVESNPVVLSGLTSSGISWAFTTFHASNWHPLTWLSHMADVELFGSNAGAHHMVNVGFHMVNAVLLFLVLGRMTGSPWRSGFVAAMFAVHPLHVESVAWVAERKDVLSGFFMVLTMWAYVRYAERPGFSRYISVAILFALGLLSKPMLVTLPFALLLLDWWPLGRVAGSSAKTRSCSQTIREVSLPRLVLEKLPLLVLSAGSGVVTYIAQKTGGALAPFESYPLGTRLANAGVAYLRYLGKFLWPSSLSVYYPHPSRVGEGLTAGWITGAALVLFVITLLTILSRTRRPYLATGWFWFLGTLVPVIGIVQVGGQAMADRYAYIPLIGVYIMVAWGVADAMGAWRFRRHVSAVLAVTALLAFGAVSARQVGYWQSSTSLFSHALEVSLRDWSESWLIHYNLGVGLQREGKSGQAEDHYRETLKINPSFGKAHNNLGVILHKRGNVDDAMDHYRAAVRADPGNAEARFNLGSAFLFRGMNQEAISEFREVLRLEPGHRMAGKYLKALIGREGA